MHTSRKDFLRKSLAMAGLSLLSADTLFASTDTSIKVSGTITVQQIIDKIIAQVPGGAKKETVDTLKSGSGDTIVTGIIVTMFPTISTIRKAIELKANFIIAHEPSFYNHDDNKTLYGPNEVVAAKIKLLKDNNITVWRFHDYAHALLPDAIEYGVVKKAGWTDGFKKGTPIIDIPTQSLQQLGDHLKKSLQINHIRMMGDLTKSCKRIALMPGAWGPQMHLQFIKMGKPDVIIIGEAQEWETIEYIRDAQALDKGPALIVLGHAVSEEPGMEWVTEWLRPQFPELTIIHIPSGDPFTWQ